MSNDNNDTTDLTTTTEGQFLVLADEESAALIADAAPSPSDLQKLVVPSGTGGAAFVIEKLEGEEFMKTLEVVVAYESAIERAFYATDVGDGDAGPPHCFSPDGKTGVGFRDVDAIRDADGDIDALGYDATAQACADCAWSKYGSALGGTGKGQACKQKVRLIVFSSDQLLPMVLQVPPTSLKALRRFKLQLLNGRKKLSQVVTSLSLQKVAGSPDYYTVEFNYVRDLGERELERLGDLAEVLSASAEQ